MSTNVPKEFEGRGIAKILAIAAFEHFSSIQTPMKLTCWYLDGYIKRNPNSKYSDLVLKQSWKVHILLLKITKLLFELEKN